MKHITLLGAGLVGKAIAIDLSTNYKVKVADLNEDSLSKLSSIKNIETVNTDLLKKDEIKKIIKDTDLVIGAVPGFMGFETLKTVIEEGKDIVDISFFDEDPFELDKLAKDKKVTAVVDCGVAPGMSNIILGYHNSKMKIDSFECYVGGLPKQKELPWQYKAPFSPVDVIEEYTRPARIVENGKIVTKPALSEPDIIEFERAGKLEAFNTDGLRSLIKTMNIPDMKEKTLRYPGHIEYIKILKESGFFNEEEIEIDGKKISPLKFTSQILFPLWKLKESEKEFTVLKLIIKGTENEKQKEIVYNLYDEFDEETNTTSMARTTGYTCTAAANLILNNVFDRKGICPPEYIGRDERAFRKINDYLKERNVNYNSIEKLE